MIFVNLLIQNLLLLLRIVLTNFVWLVLPLVIYLVKYFANPFVVTCNLQVRKWIINSSVHDDFIQMAVTGENSLNNTTSGCAGKTVKRRTTFTKNWPLLRGLKRYPNVLFTAGFEAFEAHPVLDVPAKLLHLRTLISLKTL